jgi:hypothetical protein
MRQHRYAFGRILCVVACGWCVATAALAQPPKRDFEPSKVNVDRLRWLRYKMVAGRIVTTSSYPEGMNISFGPSLVDGRLKEHLQLLILKDQATLDYSLSGARNVLAIRLSEGGNFQIRSTRAEPPSAFHFLQPVGRELSLSITEKGMQRILSGRSFWHLYLADPKWVAAELIPQLELLRPGWKLAEGGAAIEEAVFRQAQAAQAPDTRRWERLVAQLASANFAERESAQRELARAGQVVLPYLESLPLAELDAEQAARIKTLVEKLSANYEDTTERVVAWLAGDRQVWLSLLSRPELAKRQAAAEQLAELTGGAIEFDPAADEATRREQLVVLQSRLRTSSAWREPRDEEPSSLNESAD